MGIVEVKRGQRTRIRENLEGEIINPLIFQFIVEQATTQDLIEFRLMIDQAFTIIAMKKATDDDIERIRQTLDRFERIIEQGHPKMEDDMAFHYMILACTHNPFVIQTGKAILQLFRSLMGESVKEHPYAVLEDHRRIFKAFCQKDEQAVKDAIMHVKGVERWRAILERDSEDEN
jgi:GntR family transcriptional repressor for pyruvate dehydrogenase complex